MADLKKHGFVIGVVVMVLLIGVASYFLVIEKAMIYSKKKGEVRSYKNRLDKYNKPVKTKHLAKRLKVDSTELMVIINKLRGKGKVDFKPQTDKFSDEPFGWGWVKL